MGFIVMVASLVLGLLLLAVGVAAKYPRTARTFSVLLGLALIVFAVWLAFPK